MTHFMEEKLKMLDKYIKELNTAVEEKNTANAERLQTEVIAVYESEIESLRNELDNYNVAKHWGGNTSVDYIGDARLLSAKLVNYKLNLASGLYRHFKDADGTVNVTQQVSQDVTNTVTLSLEQTIKNINELPSSELSDQDKEILNGKLASISVESDKQKRWEKVGNALKWIAEKGIEVGTTALPYIVKALEAGS